MIVADEADSPSLDFHVVEVVQGAHHGGAGSEFHDAFARPIAVRVRERHFTSAPHVIFQILSEEEKPSQLIRLFIYSRGGDFHAQGSPAGAKLTIFFKKFSALIIFLNSHPFESLE